MAVRRAPQISPRRKVLSALVALAFSGASLANPTAPSVVSGTASFATTAKTLTVTNSPSAIINWQGFSIGAGETTRFQQQSAASAVLNRVVGQDPSAILGTLSSNGRVFLLNPNGIVFGAGSRVDVAGLVASTLNLSNQDFLAGRLNFEAGAVANPIVNYGNVETPAGGRVYLIAPNIENHGVISTPQGQTILAAGRSVQLVEADVPNLRVELQAGGEALNVGQILADGGSAGIYAGLINQRGIVRANSVSRDASGKIVFRAAKIVNEGEVRADGPGGKVEIAAIADASSKGATGFENRGTVSANTVEIVTEGNTYAFGAANYGEIRAAERVTMAVRDNALVNSGTIKVAKGGRADLSADLITVAGSVRAPGGVITANSRSIYQSGSMDASDAEGRGGEIRINTSLA